MRSLLLVPALLCAHFLSAQEVKATVQVIGNRLQTTNKQILTSLQNSIQQFINTRKWTEDNFESREKIEISIFVEVVNIQNTNDFTATMQVQSIRPVFNSSYKSTIFSFNDEEVYFTYKEFENLMYQENQNLSDLSTIMAYYVNICLGYDYDSFGELGGSPYFKKSQNIVNLMSGKAGWNQNDGRGFRNKYYLAENLTNGRYDPLRKLVYNYHRKGMDIMYDKPNDGRGAITTALKSLQELNRLVPNSLLQKTFFSTKWSELVEIYKGATVPEKNDIVTLLVALDPTNSQRYEKIKL